MDREAAMHGPRPAVHGLESWPLVETNHQLDFPRPSPLISHPSEGVLASLNGLDHFIQDLQRCDQSNRQLRILLKGIAQSINARAVFIHSVREEGVFEAVGQSPLNPHQCQDFLRNIIGDTPGETQLLRTDLAGRYDSLFPGLQSAALVQLSKSKETWVVALSFSTGNCFQDVDLKVMVLARRLLGFHSRQLRTAEKLRETLLGVIHCLTASIDAKDPYTCGHSERVARIAVRIGEEMRFSKTIISDIYLAGLLHDIGKIGVKDSVLQKPGKLTEEEMLEVQAHPVIGDRIIANISQLQHVRPGVRHHHERVDGQGYPDRLAGENIPLLARILAVADSCDAMMSARPYRPPMPSRKMEAIMVEGAGTQWDPKVVEPFMRCRMELYGICQRGIGDSICLAVDHAVQIENDLSWRQSITGHLLREEAH